MFCSLCVCNVKVAAYYNICLLTVLESVWLCQTIHVVHVTYVHDVHTTYVHDGYVHSNHVYMHVYNALAIHA